MPKSPAVLFFALLFSQVLLAQTQPSQTDSGGDAQSAVKAVLRAQTEAWNRADLKGFMDGYWKSPDLIFVSGMKETHGWEQVYRNYQTRYQSGWDEMGKLTLAYIEPLHILSPELAYIDGEYHLTTSAGKESHGAFTLIFRKFPEGWRIVHDRTCAE